MIILVFLLFFQSLSVAPVVPELENTEFLFNGGLRIVQDKTYCLNKIMYRKPTEKGLFPSRILAYTNNDNNQVKIDSMLTKLESSDMPFQSRYSEIVVDNIGHKYINFFSDPDFQNIYVDSIKSYFLGLSPREQPRFSKQFQNFRFIFGAEDALDLKVNDIFNRIDKIDYDLAISDGVLKDVIFQVLLYTTNKESEFHSKPEGLSKAWNRSYFNNKYDLINKVKSENTVRSFYLTLYSRISDHEEIPSFDIALIGNPVTIEGKNDNLNEIPTTYNEDVVAKPLNVEIIQNPKVINDLVKPYQAMGTNNKLIPEFPDAINEEVPNKGGKCPNIIQEPFIFEIPKIVEDDLPFRSEFPEIQRTLNIRKGLTNYQSLTPQMKRDIDNCDLSLTNAIKRCERYHGDSQCTKISSTYVGPKCPIDMERVGCCLCVEKCPEGFRDQIMTCKKPKNYLLRPREDKTNCYLSNAKECEQLGTIWTPKCKPGFIRIGSSFCLAICPSSQKDIGTHCLKSNSVTLGDVFMWTEGDE